MVATPMFVLLKGADAQQWMCAIVSFDPKPLNVALIVSVWAVGSSTIVARPVPAEALGGFSLEPDRPAVNVMGLAWAAGTDSIISAMSAKVFAFITTSPYLKTSAVSYKHQIRGRKGAVALLFFEQGQQY
jgi:hypothetical protein